MSPRTRSAREKAQDRLGERAVWDDPLLELMGKRIRTERKRRKKTIAQLARSIPKDAAFLGEIERGRVNVTVSTLSMIARALGVPIYELLMPRRE